MNPEANRLKALHALLYVVSRLPQPANIYNVLKCVYYADRQHLEDFGRQMYAETYCAMEHGPVPSLAYDIVKYVAGRSKWDYKFQEALESLAATDMTLRAKNNPNLELFSKSELICLSNSAKTYGSLSFAQLKKISHQGEAFRKASHNGEMSINDLADELDKTGALKKHLTDRHPGEA